MTENEAIYVLRMIETNSSLPVEVKELSIKALEDVQQYRETKNKTIEQLKERVKKINKELANIKEKDVSILMAKKEYLIGKKLAYATAIDIIRAGEKE